MQIILHIIHVAFIKYNDRFRHCVNEICEIEILKWGSPTTQSAAPEFRIQESEVRIVVSASRTDLIFLFFIFVDYGIIVLMLQQ